MGNWAQQEPSPRKGLIAVYSEPEDSCILGLAPKDGRKRKYSPFDWRALPSTPIRDPSQAI